MLSYINKTPGSANLLIMELRLADHHMFRGRPLRRPLLIDSLSKLAGLALEQTLHLSGFDININPAVGRVGSSSGHQ